MDFSNTTAMQIDGTTLAYRDHGQGQPVVFVHGDLSDLRTWEAQLPAIGGSYRAIAYSRRYARPNPDISAGADNPMERHVEDLAEFLHAVDAAPAHLVGNSWGAFVCLLTAMRHPELVRTLVLEEPPVLTLVASAQPQPSEVLRLLVSRPRTGLALLTFGATAMGPAQKAFGRDEDEKGTIRFARGVLGGERFDRLSAERLAQVHENRATLKAALLGEGFPPLPEQEVRAVTAPVVLLTGEHSPAFFQRLADRLEELLPDVVRHEVAGASHLIHEDRPDDLNEAILRFLDTPGAEAGPPG